MTQRFATVIECIAAAVADEAVSDDEAAEIRARWESLKSLVESFVRGCERRDFSGVNGALLHPDDSPAKSGRRRKGAV